MRKNHKKTNILLLFADQQRYDTIAAAGYPHMKTPNLDRIANEGCLFQNAYSPSPVCIPARHCLITGQRADKHGYYHNSTCPIKDEGIPTIPQVLADNGYNTVAIGKMHFQPTRRHHGFAEMHLMEEVPTQKREDAYLKFLAENGYGDKRNIHGIRPLLYHLEQNAQVPEEYHGVNWVANESIDWLENNADKPFFMMCGWIKPHPPWNIPKKWQGYYRDADLPDPIPVSREFPHCPRNSAWFGDNDSPAVKRKIRDAYYTTISMLDSAVGRILAALEKKGVLDETMIIYTSDHGEMLQDKGFYTKMLPYESASRIPFMVRYPKRFKAGTKDKRFIDLLDIFPSILEVAGIDYLDKDTHKNYPLPGNSFLDAHNKKYQYVEFGVADQRWAMLRNERYKYIYYYNGKTEHFYDLQKDPQELTNLLNVPELVSQESFNELKLELIKLELKYAPTENIKHCKLVSFPAEEVLPELDSNKYPLWGNQISNFQRFGVLDKKTEGDLFLAEVQNATDLSAKELHERLLKEDQWLNLLTDSFNKLSGNSEELLEKLKGIYE